MGDKVIHSMSMEWKIKVQERMNVTTLQNKFHERLVIRILQAFKRWKISVLCLCRKISQVGVDDPRRVTHSIKVGLALSLVSLLYFVNPMFDIFGAHAIWAVTTVLVVFEYPVGAMLSKGLNRSCATLFAGFLGVGVSYVAEHTGESSERVILGVSIFALGAASTYSRFFPIIKKSYDYGVVVFIFTFNLIAISDYRAENIFKMAYQRMSTIGIGCALCFAINVIVFPVWAGDDLHNSILLNMEGLAASLEECVTKYFVLPQDGKESDNNEVRRSWKCVINTKATEESLRNFATWEPPHGRFFFRYPWNLYEKVGSMTRDCAYCVEAINGLLNSEIQAPFALREILKKPCVDIGRECANILRELAERIRTTRENKNPHLMMHRLKAVVENLQNSLRYQPELFIDTKTWRILEEKPLRIPRNLLEGLSKTEKLHASPVPNPSKKVDGINTASSGTIIKEQEIEAEEETQADTSRDRAGKICEMRQRKQTSCAFMEVFPLASFSALLIEIVTKLESVIMVVQELGEGAIFKSIDEQVNESPPSTSLTQTTRLPDTTIPTTSSTTD